MDQPLPRPDPEGSTPEGPPWKSILSNGSPREILARLVEGDPLDLRARCESRVRSQAILLDVHRLHLRSVAHIARHGSAYTGSPPFDVWLSERIRDATRELLRDEVELHVAGSIPRAPVDERILAVAQSLGIDPNLIGSGCVAFNRAPYDVRAAFFGLAIDGRELDSWCTENSMTAARAKAALRTALWALGVRDDLDVDEFLGGDEREG